MATNKRKKKTGVIFGAFIGMLLMATLILVPAAQAGEKTVKFKIVAPITKMEVVPVPDVPKHAIGVLERRGVAIFENGETAAYHTRLTFDSIRGGKASFSGYSDLTFADGSTWITKFQGTAQGSKPRLIKGTGKHIKGTGQFEGIKGKNSFSGKIVTPYTKDKTKGDIVLEVTSTYTLPKK